MWLVGVTDACVQIVIIRHHTNSWHIKEIFSRISAYFQNETADHLLDLQAVGELTFEARDQRYELLNRHHRVQCLMIGLALERCGNAMAGKIAKVDGGLKIG